MPFRIAVLYGSVRSERSGIGLARFLARVLRERGHHVDLVDPLETPLPMLDRMHKEHAPGEAPENMQRIHTILQGADALVVVSAEYNHSVPPALKNLVDHYQREYFFKPATIVTYSTGPWGGAHVAEAWRAILGELGMVTMSIILHVPRVDKTFEDDGTTSDDAYERRAARAFAELEWYADALKRKRAEGDLPF